MLEEVVASNDVFLPQNTTVAKQAVLVAATQKNEINVTTPANEHVLDPKLQQICTAVCLLGRNSFYALRRTAIIKVHRTAGTKFVRQVAGHKPDSHSIIS